VSQPRRVQTEPAPGHHPAGVVVVFAKAPRAGLVKTRMSPPLSPEQAADLYANLLDDVLEATGRFATELGLRAVVAVHPAEALAEIADRAPENFEVVAQRGANLGARMGWGVAEAAAAGASRILLRGSDNPVLSRSCLEAALMELSDYDLVVSPDRDGGYGLIGLRAPAPGLFDHPMSTGSVLEETLSNAHAMGLSCKELEASFDLDSVADFSELARAHAAGDTTLCPRTIAHFDACELWRFARP